MDTKFRRRQEPSLKAWGSPSLLSLLKSTILTFELQQRTLADFFKRNKEARRTVTSSYHSVLSASAGGREMRDLPCTLDRTLSLYSCAHLVPGATCYCDIHGTTALRRAFCTWSVISSKSAKYINLIVTIVSSGRKEVRHLSLQSANYSENWSIVDSK